MGLDLQRRRVRLLLFVVGIIALSITAEKCRQLVGENNSSKSGKFTVFDCFDMGSGTLACVAKEGVKMYFYNLKKTHVEKVKTRAIESSLVDRISQGKAVEAAVREAHNEGKKAAKTASREVNRVIGPIIASGWDFFEALYFGGSMVEGFLRGAGTLVGTFAGGAIGEEKFRRLGYFVGSQLGSWVGGRVGLMVYDVVNGVGYLVQVAQVGEAVESFGPSEGRSEEYVEFAQVGEEVESEGRSEEYVEFAQVGEEVESFGPSEGRSEEYVESGYSDEL